MAVSKTDSKARYNGLPRPVPSLPSVSYYDEAHYRRELREIWYRNWLYVCRADELPGPRDFLTYEIGDQNILLLRDRDGGLRAFHNTCRHRGSRLCREARGRLRGNRISCPYHSWTYDLSGALVGVPAADLGEGFDASDYPLYAVAVREWHGFVFVHLGGADAPPLERAMDPGSDLLDHWPLAELEVGHGYRRTLACNWKVFWENYNECYHCPGVHPGLSRLVPLYGRGIMDPLDDPDWAAHADDSDPRYRGERFAQGRVGLHHVCFRARERKHIDELYQLLRAMGATIVHPPEEGTWAPGYYSILFEDPDGLRLEVNHIPGKGLLANPPRE